MLLFKKREKIDMIERQNMDMFAHDMMREHQPVSLSWDRQPVSLSWDRCPLCDFVPHPCDTYKLAEMLLKALGS